MFFEKLFRLRRRKTQQVFRLTDFSFLPVAVRILTRPPKETTNKTQSNEISVKKHDVVLGLDVPVAFGEADQRIPAPHRQTRKTVWGKTPLSSGSSLKKMHLFQESKCSWGRQEERAHSLLPKAACLSPTRQNRAGLEGTPQHPPSRKGVPYPLAAE